MNSRDSRTEINLNEFHPGPRATWRTSIRHHDSPGELSEILVFPSACRLRLPEPAREIKGLPALDAGKSFICCRWKVMSSFVDTTRSSSRLRTTYPWSQFLLGTWILGRFTKRASELLSKTRKIIFISLWVDQKLLNHPKQPTNMCDINLINQNFHFCTNRAVLCASKASHPAPGTNLATRGWTRRRRNFIGQ